MDKLLRNRRQNSSIPSNEDNYEGQILDNVEYSQSEDQYSNELSDGFESDGSMYGKFANLGAPRERDVDEYVPSVALEKKKNVFNRMPTPHFKLVTSTANFKETSNITYAKYAFLALFVGISVMSFLTQGVLAIKDIVFNTSPNSEFSTVAINTSSDSSNTVKSYSEDAQNEPRGSDDGASESLSNSLERNQYQLANESSFPRLSARSYLAADLETGEIILERNESLVAPIASVSKLMTALIAEENIDMQKIAIVSRDSYNTYGAQGRLSLGEKIKVYDLMYPLLMESSNDAAEVLADAYDKGHEVFMSLMNKKAVELGMNDTYFEDPSGLNPKNVSSVRDLLKLGRHIHQKHPNLYSMTRVRQYAILKHTWFNQNRFLNYDNFLGGKNGFIDEAKKTTVSIFDVTMARGGKRPVVIVLLKSDDREGDAVKIMNFLKKNAHYQEVPAVN